MTPEQKQRIAHEISNWRNARNDHSSQITGDRMSALLQELVDAPEPEPVAVVSNFFTGRTVIIANKGVELPDGAPLYTAPPAPSVPDGWRSAIAKEFPLYDEGEIDDDKHCCEWVMLQERKRLHKILAAPTPAEAPADVARDAERLDWLEQEAKESRTGVSIVYKNQADDEGGIKRGYRLMRYHRIFSARLNLREAIDFAIAAEKDQS